MARSTNTDTDVWNIISAITHKVVKKTQNIKEFCEQQEDFSSNAHIQIYKTNTPRKEDPNKAILPTYKGYFIRKEGDPNPLPYPEKKYEDPTSYKIYQYTDPETLELLGEIPVDEYQDFAKKQGWKAKDRNAILSTCKVKRDGTVKLASHNNIFITPVGENIREIPQPEYVPEKEHNRGSGKTYHVFDKELKLVAVTRDLVGFAESINEKHAKEHPEDPEPYFKYHKPLYKTNTPHIHDKSKPQMEFYKGYCIRLESELENDTAMPLPNPFKGAKNVYNAHLNLLIWNNDEKKKGKVQAYFVEHFQQSYGRSKIDSKTDLYEKARKFAKDLEVNDGANAVFISDIIRNPEILTVLEKSGVILPKRLLAVLDQQGKK